MTDTRCCSGCGTELPPDAPLGLCPKCVLKQGLDSLHGTASSPAATGFSPPLIEDLAPHFPHLEILEFLGQGGMGAVYKARQPDLDRLVALKILSPDTGSDPAFAERFKREARSLARLNHPHIVAVYDFGQAAGLYYFVMEYVDGVDLRQMERAERLAPREALGIVVQICEALQYAHDEGIVHRDIKPENLLIDKKGRVKIADFGLAKLMAKNPKDFTLTQAEQVMGTPHYMAPEQLEHPAEVDQRADIYSLGVVFYEMLTGELPLGRFAPPSQKFQVDVRLDEVVLKTLEKEPSRRYQHASEVKTDVESITISPRPAATAGEARPAAPAAGPAAAQRPRKGRQTRTAWIVAGVLVGALLVLLAVPIVGGLVAHLLVADSGRPTVVPGISPRQLDSAGKVGVPVAKELDLGGGVLMEMVLIPAGRFMMGEGARQHEVALSKPFYLGVTEVTQAQYEAVMGTNPSEYKGATTPVESVFWDDAALFCKRLSERTGQAVRLPTEAEWEYACRADTQNEFSFGDDPSALGDYAWHGGNSRYHPHPVGQKKPNAWGLYDMHGNVHEWCADWYGEYPKRPVTTDPTGPASGTVRVLRGGSWGYDKPVNFQCADRQVSAPADRFRRNGFRVAVSVPGSPAPGAAAAP
jgi:formylglycine-generating enzyme required for sulfatase activity/predicted Ser/Thr protein kinase